MYGKLIKTSTILLSFGLYFTPCMGDVIQRPINAMIMEAAKSIHLKPVKMIDSPEEVLFEGETFITLNSGPTWKLNVLMGSFDATSLPSESDITKAYSRALSLPPIFQQFKEKVSYHEDKDKFELIATWSLTLPPNMTGFNDSVILEVKLSTEVGDKNWRVMSGFTNDKSSVPQNAPIAETGR